MKKTNTKALTEGAIFASIFTIIAYMTISIPLLGLFFIWALPLPFIIYTKRNGWKSGIVLWIVAMFVSFFMGGILLIFTAVIFGSSGVVVGEIFRRQKSAFTVLIGGSLAYIANLILYFVLSIIIFDLNPIIVIQELMMESIKTAEVMLTAIGQDPASQLVPFTDFINQLVYLAPSLIITSGIFYAFLAQLIANAVLKRMNEKVSQFNPLREWSFPKSFLWYYLVTSILVLIGLEEGTVLYIVSWNLSPILELVMTIQGLAVIFYYCHVKEFNKSIPIVMILLTLIIPNLLYLYRIIGIIDLGFELRKRIKNMD